MLPTPIDPVTPEDVVGMKREEETTMLLIFSEPPVILVEVIKFSYKLIPVIELIYDDAPVICVS